MEYGKIMKNHNQNLHCLSACPLQRDLIATKNNFCVGDQVSQGRGNAPSILRRIVTKLPLPLLCAPVSDVVDENRLRNAKPMTSCRHVQLAGNFPKSKRKKSFGNSMVLA
jgi:hypothetical protein